MSSSQSISTASTPGESSGKHSTKWAAKIAHRSSVVASVALELSAVPVVADVSPIVSSVLVLTSWVVAEVLVGGAGLVVLVPLELLPDVLLVEESSSCFVQPMMRRMLRKTRGDREAVGDIMMTLHCVPQETQSIGLWRGGRPGTVTSPISSGAPLQAGHVPRPGTRLGPGGVRADAWVGHGRKRSG